MAVTDIKNYQEFRGVDYSASPAVISDEHAQDMLNMYIGSDGVMQKRPGWHILRTFENVHTFEDTGTYVVGDYVRRNGKTHICIVAHTGEWNANHFSKDFDSTTQYAVGDYCRYKQNIRKCIVAHQGDFIETHFSYANPERLTIHGIHYVQYEPGMGMLYIHAGTRLYGTMFVRQDVGDVNGDGSITAADAALILRWLSGNSTPTPDAMLRADVDGDGVITENDARLILLMAAERYPRPNQADGVLESNYFVVKDANGNPVEMSTQQSVSFEHERRLYILDGTQYIVLIPQYATTQGTVEDETIILPYVDSVHAEVVEGYIPTTGVNGHYEYLEPQSEVTPGSTIVEKDTETVAQGSNSVQFTAVSEIKDKHILVTLSINNSSVCNALYLEPTANTVTIGYASLAYSSGSITVTSTAVPLSEGDKVTLFIKNEDDEVIISGEPGSKTNPGEWKSPEADEDRNLLQTKQINTFTTDGIHKAYYLKENGCDVNKVELYLWTRCKAVNGVDVPTQENIDHVDAGTYNGVYYYYKYIWTEVAANDQNYGWTAKNASSETPRQNEVSYTTRIKFNNTPPSSEQPNMRVTYTPRKHSSTWAITKDRGYIEKCSIVTKYGYFNNNRFFLAGNPDHRNMDFMSAVDDPTYFPNTGWTKVGSGLTAIMGYLHYGSELAILKEDNEQDATVYMRSAVLTEDNDVIFPVQQGAEGAGAISIHTNCTLRDVPLFLAKEGVYAIQGTDASQERNVPNKSFFVDSVMRKEISKMCHAVAWGDYFVMCNPATGRCFVADARYQGLPPGTNDRQHGYEWYVWDNIPALCFEVVGDRLFFGTADGRLCVFNSDWDNPKRYSDGGEFIEGQDITKIYKWNAYDGGYPIHAYYVTKRDHLGSVDFKKTMLNDGGVITLQPHERSSAAITVKTDKGEWFVDQVHTDSDEPSMVIPIRHRFKNFDSIQTRIENNEMNEGLSILALQYRYAITTNRR